MSHQRTLLPAARLSAPLVVLTSPLFMKFTVPAAFFFVILFAFWFSPFEPTVAPCGLIMTLRARFIAPAWFIKLAVWLLMALLILLFSGPVGWIILQLLEDSACEVILSMEVNRSIASFWLMLSEVKALRKAWLWTLLSPLCFKLLSFPQNFQPPFPKLYQQLSPQVPLSLHVLANQSLTTQLLFSAFLTLLIKVFSVFTLPFSAII